MSSASAPLDSGEIRVVGSDGTRYGAPAMIGHYIRAHNYAPPHEFLSSLATSPRVDADADGRCLSCGGDLVTEAVYDDLIQAIDRVPVIVTECYCARCDAHYERERLR